MLLVILGAGASHDSVQRPKELGPDLNEYRPPLAVSLFASRARPFGEAVAQHRMAAGIMGALDAAVRAGTGVETALESLVAKAQAGNASVSSALAGVRYYLRDALTECSIRWHTAANTVTNYATLLHYLGIWRAEKDEQILFVTFNYDVLLELALADRDIRFTDLPDYVGRDDYSVVKVHGSVDWGHVVDDDVALVDEAQVRGQLTRAAAAVEPHLGEIVRAPRGFEWTKDHAHALFPAIAIPTVTKTTFECPDPHIEHLRASLTSCDRVLIIGWAANDRHFLDVLHQARTGWHPRGLVVSGGPKSAQQTAEAVTDSLELATSAFETFAEVHGSGVPEWTGFSGLMSEPDALERLLDSSVR